MKAIPRRFLRINLTDGKATEEDVPKSVVADFIGGRGFGVHYLYQEMPPRTEPLSEQNKLLMVAGPLAGTSGQAVSRWMVFTKSPLTGAFARSCTGADFGAWMRFAGYDFLLIEGKAERPVYLEIARNTCRIKPADDLWGSDTLETQQLLGQRYGQNMRSACIGPAAEKLVRYTAIVTGDQRTASRCGVGTVMGSKNLKAIVIDAEGKVPLSDPDKFEKLVKEQIDLMEASKAYHHQAEMGTTTTHDITNPMGIYPVRNFRYGQQEGYQKLSGEEYRKLRTGDFGCYNCSCRCGKKHRVPSGPYAGAHSNGPEYETIWAFSGPIDNTDIGATIAANQLCDDFGLDTLSTGNAIGFAYELYEKGILTEGDTDGLELTYGNHSAMVTLVGRIARREGLGDVLAEGVMRAAAIIGKGAEAYAIHAKGLEPPAYEPRGAKSLGFNYATSNIGASHSYGYAPQEVFGSSFPRKVDRFAEEENADIVVFNQNNTASGEVGVVCSFARGWFPQLFDQMLTAATGIEEIANRGYLQRVGERIVNLERAFNVREGFRRKDDTLPHRMLTEPLHTGKALGEGQMIRGLGKFLDRYYDIRGWTRDGVPSSQKLNELGLSHATKDMG